MADEKITILHMINVFKKEQGGIWYSNNNNGYDCCCRPDISSEIKSDVRRNFGVGYNEEILFVRDTSFWNDRNQGIVITDKALYCIPDNYKPGRKTVLRWDNIEFVEYKDSDLYFFGYGGDRDYSKINISFFLKDDSDVGSIGYKMAQLFTRMSQSIALARSEQVLNVTGNNSERIKKRDFYGRIFLCYALGDLPEVRRIVAELEEDLGILIPLSTGSITKEGVYRAIENSAVFVLFVSEASKDADYIRDYVTRANNTNKNILPILINKKKCASAPSDFKLRVKPYDYNSSEGRTRLVSQLSAILGVNLENGDESGSLIYVRTDMDADILRGGEKLESVQVGKECCLRLKKGVHKLEFVAASNSRMRSVISYEVKGEGTQHLSVSLREAYIKTGAEKAVEVARDVLLKAILSFTANLAVAMLCFTYCCVEDSQYRELTTNVFGTYHIWKTNWLWYILGIVFIVFVIRAFEKFLGLKAAYKQYGYMRSRKVRP